MDDVNLAKLGEFQPVIELGDEFRATATDANNWIEDIPMMTIICRLWGLDFVKGYNNRSAEQNTHILQTFDVILQSAWQNQDQHVADSMDFFAEVLSDELAAKRLPERDMLFKDVGTYLQNIV